MDNIKRNGAGYYDPTAFQAIKNTDEIIKATAERDVYKSLYMELAEKLMRDKI